MSKNEPRASSPRTLRTHLLAGCVVVVVGSAISEAGCKDPQLAQDIVHGALEAEQIACIFNSTITNDQELATLCHIAEPLLPLVRQLVGQREGARRAGVSWGATADGGTSLRAVYADGGISVVRDAAGASAR